MIYILSVTNMQKRKKSGRVKKLFSHHYLSALHSSLSPDHACAAFILQCRSYLQKTEKIKTDWHYDSDNFKLGKDK